jgi:hypothetical protein
VEIVDLDTWMTDANATKTVQEYARWEAQQ